MLSSPPPPACTEPTSRGLRYAVVAGVAVLAPCRGLNDVPCSDAPLSFLLSLVLFAMLSPWVVVAVFVVGFVVVVLVVVLLLLSLRGCRRCSLLLSVLLVVSLSLSLLVLALRCMRM